MTKRARQHKIRRVISGVQASLSHELKSVVWRVARSAMHVMTMGYGPNRFGEKGSQRSHCTESALQ